jgi:polar amino acid transport system permease protein
MSTALTANHLEFLLQGAAWTIGLSLIGFAGGGLLGLVVALCRVSPVRALRVITAGYVQLIQGTPLLVILFMSFFGLPALGLKISPRAQWEAAECLALTRIQRMRLVVLPQAIRIATPPTVGFMVQIVKNTSLASVVGFVELARSGQLINNSVFEPFLVYFIIAALYFAMCFPLSRWSQRLERRNSPAQRQAAADLSQASKLSLT